MTNTPFSEGVQRLLRDHMTSFERLGTLLHLWENPAEEHSVRTISEKLHIAPELLVEALTGLVASGLVAAGKTEGTFRFAPATPKLAGSVEELATAYREQSAAVLSTLSVYAIERIRSGPMRAFADSFVLGKGKGDG